LGKAYEQIEYVQKQSAERIFGSKRQETTGGWGKCISTASLNSFSIST